MTPEQRAMLDGVRLSAEQRAMLDQLQAQQSDAALAQVGQSGPPEGFVLNPATGQMVDMQSPNNPYVREGMGTSIAQGAGQGVSFGWMDEVVGAGRAAMGGDGTFGERRDFETAAMREELRRARENNPVATTAAEVGGGMAAGIGAGIAGGASKAGQAILSRLGSGMGGRMAIGGLTGALEGALYGSGAADGQNIARGALMGAGVGAGLGAAAVPAIAGIAALGRPVANVLGRRLGRGNETRANRYIARAMDRSGVDPQELAQYLSDAAADGQPEYAIADAMGIEGQRALSGIARQPGPGRTMVTEALEQRQNAQGGRMSDFLADALNLTQTADEAATAMKAERSAMAGPRYTAASQSANPVDVRGALRAVDNRIAGMRGSGVTGDGIDARLARYRQRLAAPQSALGPGETARELSDFDRVLGVKQDLQDDIGAAVRAGRNNEARELGKIVSELDAALEASTPQYRTANDAFRADSVAIDQLGAGAQAARSSTRSADIVRQFNDLPASPAAQGPGAGLDARQAYRTGYGNPIAARMEAQVDGGDSSRFFRNPKSREVMGALATDPDQFARRVDREGTMYETRRQATGGSLTANNLADNAELEGAELGPLVEGARDVANFQLGNIVSRVAQSVGGENDATKELIARALLSSDAAALSPVQRQVESDVFKRLMAEAILRQQANQNAPIR